MFSILVIDKVDCWTNKNYTVHLVALLADLHRFFFEHLEDLIDDLDLHEFMFYQSKECSSYLWF